MADNDYASQVISAANATPAAPVSYGTQISDKAAFENAMRKTPWYQQFKQKFGEEPNLYAPEYNLHRAWQLGLQATPDPYDGGFPHWPDQAPTGEMLKAPDHPTIWMQYFMDATGGKNPEALGIKDYQSAKQYIGKDFVPQPVLDAINARASAAPDQIQPPPGDALAPQPIAP